MTKTLDQTSTLSPVRIAVGEDITDEQLLEVHQAQNYSVAQFGECHLSMAVGSAGWDDHGAYGLVPAGAGDAAGVMSLIATATEEDELLVDMWIDADHAAGELELGVECACEVGTSVRVVWYLEDDTGLATTSASVTCTDADNGDEVTTTVSLAGVAPTDGGWVLARISVQRAAGAGTASEVRNLRAEETPLTTLPDPDDD